MKKVIVLGAGLVGKAMAIDLAKNLDVTSVDINEEALLEPFNVRFEITSVKSHETFIYNVTSSNREVREIIVAKL